MIRLFRVFVPTSIFVLLLSEAVLLSFCYTLAVYRVLEVDPTVFLWYDGGFGRILVVVLSVLFGLHFLDFYTEIRTVSKTALILEICQAIGGAFLIEFVIAYINADWILPRRPMILGSGLALVSLSAWRILYGRVFLRAFAVQRILFLGSNPVVREIAERIASRPELGFINLGYVDDDLDPGLPIHGAKVLGRVRELREIVKTAAPDRIVAGMSERRNRMPVYDLLELRFSGIRIEEAGAAYEAVCGRICTKELRPAQLIFSGELGPDRSAVALQSAYSWLIALLGTIMNIPVVLVAALLIKLTSRGPVLFRQTRVGMGGKPFTLYKLRSMYVDAEAKTGAVWASID
ncbi:MAG: sugar transferase, partial [Bryobacteraceae bacterium]